MHKAAPRTVLLLLVVVAMLALPWTASAAGSRSPWPARALQAGELDLFSHLWSFFRKEGCRLDPGGLCAPKGGCGIDPSGLCAGKEGCNIDPSGGRCATSAAQPTQAKEGCTIDPSGWCAPKGGCGIDPSGRCLP